MNDLSIELESEFNVFTEEYKKFSQKGNKAAGTRARKALQNIRTIAFDLRKEISATKNG